MGGLIMATRVIPINPGVPHQSMQVDLDGVKFNLTLHWNEREGAWYFDLLDASNVPLLMGTKLVINVPLLRRMSTETKPPGEIVALDPSGNEGADPGLDDLGERVLLVYEEAATLPV